MFPWLHHPPHRGEQRTSRPDVGQRRGETGRATGSGLPATANRVQPSIRSPEVMPPVRRRRLPLLALRCAIFAAPAAPSALASHSGSAIRGTTTGELCEGTRDMDRLWDVQVNWTRWFDTGLLVSGFVAAASMGVLLI